MEGEAAGDAGGIAALLAFVAEHERALTFDFRARLHMPLSSLGWEIPFGEGIHLVMELRRDTGSHTYASEHGYQWVASFAEIAQMAHAEWYMNVHRDRKEAPDPIRLPRPWPDRDENADVTADERAELERDLLSRSAIRD